MHQVARLAQRWQLVEAASLAKEEGIKCADYLALLKFVLEREAAGVDEARQV